MRMRSARSSSRSRFSRWFASAIQLAAGSVLGVVIGVSVGGVALMDLLHDHYEVQGLPSAQIYFAAKHLQDSAKLGDGLFPESGDEALRLLAPSAEDWLDPWGKPFRYERLGDGRRARIFTLGEDGEPGGGEDCDADIVVWFDATDVHTAWDVRVEPAAWGTTDAADGSNATGKR